MESRTKAPKAAAAKAPKTPKASKRPKDNIAADATDDYADTDAGFATLDDFEMPEPDFDILNSNDYEFNLADALNHDIAIDDNPDDNADEIINEDTELVADEFEQLINDDSGPIYDDVLGGNDAISNYEFTPELETDVGIDPELTTGHMLSLIYSEVNKNKFAGHHIQSMNAFNRIGIKQIVTKLYTVEGRQKNLRDKTDEDREITDISYIVRFTDANLSPPTIIKPRTGNVQPLTPSMARIANLNYSATIRISATIEATAVYKNGTTKTRTAEIKDHRIASIPCAVGTELCNTYKCTKKALALLEEDPLDIGGYFILKGNEWVVHNLENITNNTFHVYKNMYQNEIVRGTFLSKPGDAFENSYQIILRYLNNGNITVEIQTVTKFNKFEIPFYILFRLMGMTRDYDIVDNIVYGVDNKDTTTVAMLEVLEKAFEVDDGEYASIKKSTDPVEIAQYLSHKIFEPVNPAGVRRDENATKYLNNAVLSTIDRFVFPHIGSTPEFRIKKMRFLGHLINRLLGVYMGILDPTDRDSYKNKRIHSAGTSIAKTFKTQFNVAIVQTMRKQLAKDFKSTQFSQVQLAESVKASINSDDLEKTLSKVISSGAKTVTLKRNEMAKRMSTQTLYHKNDMEVKSTLSTVNTPNSSASKQNERADEMRRVHPSYVGYIDISQSADSGEKVGMTKQMACTASVCGASSSYVLKKFLLADPAILHLDTITPSEIKNLTKVFVNGDWIGCNAQSHELVRRYRMLRRYDHVHATTTIVWELHAHEVYFWTDVGRMMRPLVIVYNNIDEYRTDRKVEFKQWIKLTHEHIRGLRTGKLTMDALREMRVIEYISPEEQENAFIAPNINELRAARNNIQRAYTHMDIDQAIFGIVTLAGPLANHSNAVRNTMYTNHRKQSVGWFALNYPFRIDKSAAIFQHYCERNLVSTFSNAFTYPNGYNAIVALALYGGSNQEDSIIVNSSSVDCGAYNASYYSYEKAEIEKDEQFGNPDPVHTMDIKRDAVYEYTQNGFIAEGTVAKRGYVLIVKTVKIPKPTDQFLYMDRSIVYKRDEPVFIERVVRGHNEDDSAQFAKVKTRANRPLMVGDKLSSLSGNKGIVALKVPRCDMPYCEDGLVPDLIVNSHSIPTRMAVNQIIECVLGQLAAIRGASIDATAFRNIDIDGAIAELETHGVKYGGHRRMYNGKTGDYIDTLIFVGPTTYQRLSKFVVDEQYATRTGPTSALTRQPLDGKSSDGGLRLGEMETWCLVAEGSLRALFEKYYTDSDGFNLPICRLCGNRAIVNERLGLYKCKHCGDNADIVNVASSWVANVFFQEASAMNVKMKFELNPFMFPK